MISSPQECGPRCYFYQQLRSIISYRICVIRYPLSPGAMWLGMTDLTLPLQKFWVLNRFVRPPARLRPISLTGLRSRRTSEKHEIFCQPLAETFLRCWTVLVLPALAVRLPAI